MCRYAKSWNLKNTGKLKVAAQKSNCIPLNLNTAHAEVAQVLSLNFHFSTATGKQLTIAAEYDCESTFTLDKA
jgi:hypothetical protein